MQTLEAWPRIELGYTDLQSAASPLRHQAGASFEGRDGYQTVRRGAI